MSGAELSPRMTARERQEIALEIVREQSVGLLATCLANVVRQVESRPDDEDLAFRAIKACTGLLPKEVTVTAGGEAPAMGRPGTAENIERLLRLADAHRDKLTRESAAADVVDGVVVEDGDYSELI